MVLKQEKSALKQMIMNQSSSSRENKWELSGSCYHSIKKKKKKNTVEMMRCLRNGYPKCTACGVRELNTLRYTNRTKMNSAVCLRSAQKCLFHLAKTNSGPHLTEGGQSLNWGEKIQNKQTITPDQRKKKPGAVWEHSSTCRDQNKERNMHWA